MIKFGDENDNMELCPFLMETVEGEGNEIAFIVSLAFRGEKGSGIDDDNPAALNEILSNCFPVYPDENNTCEIIFEDYVLHMTRNESYTYWDSYEIRRGKYFILFERSRLLDSLPHFVDCGFIKAVCTNTCKHYGIYCQNHIVDIITANEPVIRPYTGKR